MASDTSTRRPAAGTRLGRPALAIWCAALGASGGAAAQTANREPPPPPAPRSPAVPAPIGSLPADSALQLPRAQTDIDGPASDPLLSLPVGSNADSIRGANDVPARDEGVLELTTNMAEQAVLAAGVRPVSRTVNDDRPRDFPVLTRRRSAYDPVGVQAGAFTVFPSVTSSANYTTNVYLQPDGVGDGFGTLRGSVVARSDFSRHFVDLDGFVEGVGFLNRGSENGVSYRAHALGRWDVYGRDTLAVELTRERRLVDRSAVGELISTRSPVRFNRTVVDGNGTIVRGRTSITGRVGITKLDFEDARTRTGAPLDEDYRDYIDYEVGAEAAYQFGGARFAYLSVAHDWQRARLAAVPLRDLDRTEILVGLRNEITPLIQGRIAVGYLQVSFRDPTIRTQHTPAFDLRLDYLFTPLTTFTLTARRTLQNVSSFTSPGAIVSTTRIGVDHELYRNVILSAGVAYNHASYIRDDAKADLIGGDVSAQYLLNRRMRLAVSVSERSRRTTRLDGNREFDALTLGASFTFQL